MIKGVYIHDDFWNQYAQKLNEYNLMVIRNYQNGKITLIVPDSYIAWHAGKSSWKKYKSLNKYSIGIELSNPGHDNKYKEFSKKQLKALKQLLKYLIKPNHIGTRRQRRVKRLWLHPFREMTYVSSIVERLYMLA